MTVRRLPSTSTTTQEPIPDASRVAAHPGTTRPVDLERLAPLVADGVVPLPDDLDPDDLRRLVAAVRQHRRERLVDYLARVLARSVAREDARHRQE